MWILIGVAALIACAGALVTPAVRWAIRCGPALLLRSAGPSDESGRMRYLVSVGLSIVVVVIGFGGALLGAAFLFRHLPPGEHSMLWFAIPLCIGLIVGRRFK